MSLPLFLCPFFSRASFSAFGPGALAAAATPPSAAAGARKERKEGLPPPLLLAFFFSLSLCLIASSPFLREAAASKRERERAGRTARGLSFFRAFSCKRAHATRLSSSKTFLTNSLFFLLLLLLQKHLLSSSYAGQPRLGPGRWWQPEQRWRPGEEERERRKEALDDDDDDVNEE